MPVGHRSGPATLTGTTSWRRLTVGPQNEIRSWGVADRGSPTADWSAAWPGRAGVSWRTWLGPRHRAVLIGTPAPSARSGEPTTRPGFECPPASRLAGEHNTGACPCGHPPPPRALGASSRSAFSACQAFALRLGVVAGVLHEQSWVLIEEDRNVSKPRDGGSGRR